MSYFVLRCDCLMMYERAEILKYYKKCYLTTYTRGPTLYILGSYWILSIVMVKALVGGSEGFSGAVGDCTLLWGKFSENMQRCEDKQ